MISRLIQRRISVYHHSLPNNEQADNFSASDSDTEEEVEGALETTLSMICPGDLSTRLGRIRTLITIRMTDFLQAGLTGM